jgi:hypothetical protein
MRNTDGVVHNALEAAHRTRGGFALEPGRTTRCNTLCRDPSKSCSKSRVDNKFGDRMKIAHVSFLVLLFSMRSPAYSADLMKDYDPAETRCHAWDDAGLKNFVAQLDYADQVLPNIPPEEDRYLTAESAAAKKVYMEELEANNWKAPAQSQGNMRYAALEARPLYIVWGVRKDLVDAKRAIAQILDGGPARSYRKNREAEKLERTTSAITAVTIYSLHMQEFLTKQTLAQQNRMITSEQWSRLYSSALTLNSDLGYYMSCKLAKIMGRQSFN